MRRLLILLACAALASFVLPAHAGDGGLRPPVPGQVLRGFDADVGRYDAGHRGVDLAADVGESIRAAADGVVGFAGQVAGRPSVSVRHSNGRRTTYTPVVGSVMLGQRVGAGEVIGVLSEQRHCTDRDCLHWGLTDGVSYWDPLAFGSPAQIRLLPRGTRPDPPPSLGIPTGSYPVAASITSRFGMRVHPVTREYKLHDGVDFGAACGTPIVSPWAGIVKRAHYNAGYGYRVIIDHGGFSTAYAHMPGLELSVGARVAAGQRVGAVGTTGRSTGCHLHWMAWQGSTLVDPLTLVE